MWVLGSESRSSARSASVPNLLAVSPASGPFSNFDTKQLVILTLTVGRLALQTLITFSRKTHGITLSHSLLLWPRQTFWAWHQGPHPSVADFWIPGWSLVAQGAWVLTWTLTVESWVATSLMTAYSLPSMSPCRSELERIKEAVALLKADKER